jgi:hypothetical protein
MMPFFLRRFGIFLSKLLGDVFDEMHLLFAPPLAPTNFEVAPGAPQEKRPDA